MDQHTIYVQLIKIMLTYPAGLRLSLHLNSFSVYASSEGSDKLTHMRSLVLDVIAQ